MRGIEDYAVVYDISDDKERRLVDKALKGFGFRIQKSVFECRLNRRAKNELIGKLERLEVKTGFIRLYRLEYATRNLNIGAAPPPTPDKGNVFIV